MADSIHIAQPWMLWLLCGLPLLVAGMLLRRTERFHWSRWAGVAVRMLVIAVAILALADVRMLRPQRLSHMPSVYVLEDRSASVSTDPNAAGMADTLAKAIPEERPVERLLFAAKAWRIGEQAADQNGTDLERALDRVGERGLDLAGSDVVVFTDGRATRGDSVAATTRLAARGARVHVVPIGRAKAMPSEISGVEPPIGVSLGGVATVRVTVRSSRPDRVTVRLLHPDGKPADARTIPLDGESTLLLRATPTLAGEAQYKLLVESEGKVISQRAVQFDVGHPARVLLVDAFPRDLDALARAIGEPGMPVDIATPAQLPEDLSRYAAVVLSDLSGSEFSAKQRLAIKQFVEDRGSGLVFIGGANVLPSKWTLNALQSLLPVTMEEKPAKVVKQLPDVSVCFVIDSSGSMSGAMAGGNAAVSKLELVKSSVVASLDALPESARVSVVAFDSKPTLVVDNASLSNKDVINKLIGTIGLGGGTDVYAGAAMGLTNLQKMPGDRFFVLLTDGQSGPPVGRSWQDLTRSAAVLDAKWTSIAVGDDADQQLLQQLAADANGKYIFCRDADQVPRVFIDHAKSVRHVAENKMPAFTPRRGAEAADLPDVGAALPTLSGAVLGNARPGARVQLVDEAGKPIMASWKAGAGKVIAYTSDVKNAWGGQWLRWDQFGRFWTHTVRSVTAAPPPMHMTATSSRRNDMHQFRFVVTDPNGQPADGMAGQAVRPDGRSVSIDWKQGQPGVYTARVDMANETDNLPVRFRVTRAGSATVSYTTVLPAAQNQEVVAWGSNLEACREIALAGNGICSNDPQAITGLLGNGPTVRHWTASLPLWPALVALLLALWPIDVWCRKVLG